MTTTFTLMRGVSGSGKSTAAKELLKHSDKTIIVSRDDLRLSLYHTDFGPPINEDFITEIETEIIGRALVRGISVVNDNTNLIPQYVEDRFEMARTLRADIVLKEVEVPLAVARYNNQQRYNNGGRFVPEHIIKNQHELFYKHQTRVHEIYKQYTADDSFLVEYLP